jgi:hypothetical protein
MKGQIVTGSVEGTGAAINVSLGFTPVYVKLINIDDAGGLEPTFEWWSGMASANALKTLGTPTRNLATSNGISTYAGSDTASKGFTIGADTDVNASGETILYIAIGPNE